MELGSNVPGHGGFEGKKFPGPSESACRMGSGTHGLSNTIYPGAGLMSSREDGYSIKPRRTLQPQYGSARGEALFLGYPGSLHGGPLPFQSLCSLSQVPALNLLIPGKQPTGPACRDRAVDGAVLLSSGQKLRKSKATLVQSDPEPL